MGNLQSESTKRELLESLLRSGMVLLHLDAQARGVDVPPSLRHERELGLNLSLRFPGPLAVDDAGVQATLSFAGEPYCCALPFQAVYAMVAHDSGEGFFFPADAPPTALAALAAVLEEEAPSGTKVRAPRVAPPALSVIDGGAEPSPCVDPPRNEVPPEGRRPEATGTPTEARPQLRLVK